MDEILPLLLGGLVLFIYSISQLSKTMEQAFTDKARAIISKYTHHLIPSILIGTVITILLGSSSAVIIITIVFINAKAMEFRNALGIILGANIGTTFSSQLIALDISKYAIIPLFIGLALDIFARQEKYKTYGRGLLYFGMLFFGLFIIEHSVWPLRESQFFESWIAYLDNPWKGAMVGGLVTLVIQSSSATVGLAITLGKQHLISIAGGVAVMLGAELGTCSDTLIATINGKRQALKAGIFHLSFNLITILIGLLLFYPFVQVVKTLSSNQGIDHHIANAHVLFNVAGVIIFLPLARYFEKWLNDLLPDKQPLTTP